MLNLRTLAVAILISSTQGVWAQCSTQEDSVAASRRQIQGDENAIRRVNPALQAGTLNDWAEASEGEKRKILIGAFEDEASTPIPEGLDRVEKAVANSLKPTTLAGVYLPSGLSSINSFNGKKIVSALESRGVGETVLGQSLIDMIRGVASTSGKRAKIQLLMDNMPYLKGAEDARELSSSDGAVDATATVFQIAASMAGRLEFPIAVETALFKGAENFGELYIITQSVKSLSASTGQQLQAINILSLTLKNHVAQLQRAKAALGGCQAEHRNASAFRIASNCQFKQEVVDADRKSVAEDQGFISRGCAGAPDCVAAWTKDLIQDQAYLLSAEGELEKCTSQ